MPLVAFIALDGREIPFADVRIARAVEDFGLSPADVAAIMQNQDSRKDVRRDQVTASQIGSGARELYLKETTDYAREPKREKAALLGTMKHGMLNIEHPALSVEERVTSKSGRFSARYDTYVPETGTLRDRKGVNVFKLLMVLKHGVETHAWDYVYQLNLTALILKQLGRDVKEMFLDFEPTGVGKLEKIELAEKYGITDPTFIPIAVPFLPQAEVLSTYEQLRAEKVKAHDTGIAPPMCTKKQTWGGKKCADGWCAVAKECARLALERGEPHPLNAQLAVQVHEAEVIEEEGETILETQLKASIAFLAGAH